MPRKTPRFYLALGVGKLAQRALKLLGRNGGQVPGALAERIDPQFLAHIDKPGRIVFVTGTNGKTTTTNLLDDLLVDNGFDPVTNRAGGNVKGGVMSSLIGNASLSGAQRKEFACMELDELSSRLVLPHVTPDLLVVCNLYRDSFMRNANPDYIFSVISPNVSPQTELVLNADDLISCRLAPQATKRTYFSVGPLPSDTSAPQDIVSDLTACPECGGALEYEYCHLRHLGRARCTRCGFANPEPDFVVTRVDEAAHTFTVRENREPGMPEHDYKIGTYSITNLYNMVAAIVTARRLGVSADAIAASLDRGINITKLRYSDEESCGVWFVNMAAKGENSTATSTAIANVCREPGKKAVTLIMSDYYLATSPYSSEYTGWYYQTDFEHLAGPQVEQVIVVGARGEDLLLRLRLAGVDASCVSLVPDVDAAAKALRPEGLDGVYVCYDIFNGDQATRCRELMRERVEAVYAGDGGLAQAGEARAAQAGEEPAARAGEEPAAQAGEERPALDAPGRTAQSVAGDPTQDGGLLAGQSGEELVGQAATPVPTDVAASQGAGAVIEVLYPEFGNQAGDNGNVLYLKACLPGATYIETPYGQEPAFVTRDVSAVVLGSMTERHQQLAAAALKPYAARLAQLADAGVPMLFTHSAAEILGTSFGTPGGGTAEGLGVLGVTTSLDMPKRYLGSVVGSFVPQGGEPIRLIGFKIQFTQMRSDGEGRPFAMLERGWGLAEGNMQEGVVRGGLIATWVIGPLLPSNPDFARWFCEQVTGGPVQLAFESEARAAYEVRLAELTHPLPKGKTINP